MDVDVTETIFYKQDLKHVTIPIAKKNTIVSFWGAILSMGL